MKIATKVQITLEFTTNTAFSGGATFEQVTREATQSALTRMLLLLEAGNMGGVKMIDKPRIAMVMTEIDE